MQLGSRGVTPSLVLQIRALSRNMWTRSDLYLPEAGKRGGARVQRLRHLALDDPARGNAHDQGCAGRERAQLDLGVSAFPTFLCPQTLGIRSRGSVWRSESRVRLRKTVAGPSQFRSAPLKRCMIRTLTERTNTSGPTPPLAEDNLQLLKRARPEERKVVDGGKEGVEGSDGAAASAAGMIASIMVADMPKAGPPPRVLAPEIATLAPEIAAEAEAMLSLRRNDSMVFSESTRTERASESDGSERSEHEGSDDDAASQAGVSHEESDAGVQANVSPEEGEAGAALLLALTDPASLLLAFQRGAAPESPLAGSLLALEAATAAPEYHPLSNPQKRRGVADRASHFYCKHPECGKSYGCPDAVRKHCRKKHSEWLRRLGASSGPSGYCRWD